MIYKFKSTASADLVMLGPQGDQLLRLLGREPAAKGIIENAAMPAALHAIRQAIAQAEVAGGADEVDAEASDEAVVSLRQRLWPMVDMLQRARDEQADIVWGV